MSRATRANEVRPISALIRLTCWARGAISASASLRTKPSTSANRSEIASTASIT